VIALISLAYLEEDALLLSITLLAAVIVLTVELAAVWETVLGAKWIERIRDVGMVRTERLFVHDDGGVRNASDAA
jgi:hypothetical protein